MSITQSAYDRLGDLIEAEEVRLRAEMDDKPEWMIQESMNELWEAHELLYDQIG